MDVEGEVPAAAVENSLGGAEQLTWEAYAAQYSGRTRLARLLFIAERCGVESMELEALRMAYDEFKKGEDTMLYRDTSHLIEAASARSTCLTRPGSTPSIAAPSSARRSSRASSTATGHYGSCLEHLEKLKPNLLLDIHLHLHVQTLYMDIRHKAITQYTLPFISVDLNTMAAAFKTSVSMLEKELAALITENKIQARIDSHNKILYARHAVQRNATFQRALQTGNEFETEVKSMLLRANLIKHDYNQRTGQRKM